MVGDVIILNCNEINQKNVDRLQQSLYYLFVTTKVHKVNKAKNEYSSLQA